MSERAGAGCWVWPAPAVMDRVHAFRPTSEADSILYLALPAGRYTAQLSGAGGATGNGLVEIYSDSAANGEQADYFVNLSSRCFVGTDASIAIAGLVLEQKSTVLLRAVGPSLSPFGVSRTLRKPVLTLLDRDGVVVASNLGWRRNPEDTASALGAAMQRVSAFGLSNDDDAALVVTLPPGLYTAQVRGVNTTTGNGLVEVYLLD